MNALTSSPDWNQVVLFLIDCALKGAVVIAIAGAAAWLLRRGSAAARHTVWTAAIAAQILIPVLGLLLPTWRIGIVDEPAWVSAASAPRDAVVGESPASRAESPAPERQVPAAAVERNAAAAPAASAPDTPTAATPTSSAWRPSGPVIAAALWMLGCIAVLGRLVAGTAVVSRMAVRGERVVDEKWLGLMHRLALGLGITRPLTLLRGDSLGVPVTWGIVYPVVFLPKDADTWPEERRRYVLVHEMAHVKRLDAFTQLVAQFALAIFWFNPLVWVAAARMRRERENACDDYVLTHGTKPSEYASDLLELVRGIGSRGHDAAAPAFAALAMARRSEFEGRMLSILDPEVRRTSLGSRAVLASFATAVIVIAPLAAFSPFAPPAAAAIPQPIPTVGVTPNEPNVSPAPETQPVASSGRSNPLSTAATAAKTAVVSAIAGVKPDQCDRLVAPSTSSTSIHERDGYPSGLRVQLLRRRDNYCFEAALNGRITFTNDGEGISEMARSARAHFRERTASRDREVTVTDGGSQLQYAYFEDGQDALFDDDARAWFAQVLRTTVRESGINAVARVRRLDQEGGLARVLAEIDAITSSGAKRTYYMAYLDSGKPLNGTDMARLINQARRDLAKSSGDMRSVLQRIGTGSIRFAETRSAFASAVAGLESDGDKSALLTQMAMTAERDLLVDIMRVALTIGSDGDKSRLLIATAARYLGSGDSELRERFFATAEDIESDGDRSRVLISASAYGHADPAVTEAAIVGTHTMDSSGDKATVLISIASQRLLTTTRLRDAYSRAAGRIESDGDRARALAAAISGE